VFVHGLPTSGRLWDFVVERLAGAYTCIAVDLPAGPLDAERLAGALEALRASLGFPAWSMVGHDAGAVIAVHYGAAYPQRLRRLALLSPPLFPELRPPWLFRLLRRRVVGDLLAPFAVIALWHGGLQAMLERRDAATRAILEDFRRPYRGLSGSRNLLRLLRWGEPAQVLGRTAALLPRLRSPTLILLGRRDAIIPASFAERAAAALPDARAVLLESGHFLPLDAPREVCAELEPFLAAGAGVE
jgi:pimeloyl-ACP methyl ester carboxylesterase